MITPPQVPRTILIVGSGVFGLSTALALTNRSVYSATRIILLDRSRFPSPDGSSIDTSRIIRADYSSPAYAALAARAQHVWRDQSPSGLGGEGRYTESGLVLVADHGRQGEEYVRDSLENVRSIMAAVGDTDGYKTLNTRPEIDEEVGTGGGDGDWGYLNRRSGWADAEASMVWLRKQVDASGRVEFAYGEVTELVKNGSKVHGVKLKDGAILEADLTVLATGAWTPKLVDLQGRAVATGQVLAYLPISAAEQEKLGQMPVLLNMSTGMFIIPPANRLLKVARHGYGYTNPQHTPNPSGTGPTIAISLPRTATDAPDQWIPAEGEKACRDALREMIPSLADRPFTHTKICWYTDTPDGDFLITYHPEFEGLFLATGGSGHGFKFLPVIGDKIADCLEGKCAEEFKEKWAWRKGTVENVCTKDGSRGGLPGMILDNELMKGRLST